MYTVPLQHTGEQLSTTFTLWWYHKSPVRAGSLREDVHLPHSNTPASFIELPRVTPLRPTFSVSNRSRVHTSSMADCYSDAATAVAARGLLFYSIKQIVLIS